MKHKTRSWFRLILFLLLVGGLYLLFRGYEQSFLFHPSPTLTKTPQDLDLAFDSVILTTADDVNIHGWYVPQNGGEDQVTTAEVVPCLLYLDGSNGNCSDRLQKSRVFHDLGFDVFIIDYRGYGRSAGAPTERGLMADALAAYSYVLDKRGVKPQRLYLYGEDLGAAVAIDLATKVRAAGLIAEGATASVLEEIEQAWPLIPWQYLLQNKFDSVSKMRNVHIPVLFIHSSDDEVVSFNDSRRLFSLANEPRQLVQIHGSHADAFVNSFDVYYDSISQFVRAEPKNNPVATSASTSNGAELSNEPSP